MKKNVIIIVTILVVALLGVGIFYMVNSSHSGSSNDAKNESGGILNKDSKVLVVYYSAQSHTETVAEKIASNLGADIFEIVPKVEYSAADLDWSDSSSRVSREHDDEGLRDAELVSTSVDDWELYDTILIGYPIWWGEAAWVANNFVKDNDFTGKIVIPFCTSASSSIGSSAKLLEDMTKTGNWKTGYRFSSSATDVDIKTFTDSIK